MWALWRDLGGVPVGGEGWRGGGGGGGEGLRLAVLEQGQQKRGRMTVVKGRVRGVHLLLCSWSGAITLYDSAQYQIVTCCGAPRKVGEVGCVLSVLRRSGTQQFRSVRASGHGLQCLA